MRTLKAVTIFMGVLIIAATALLVILIIRRVAAPVLDASRILPQPPGTHITGIAAAGPDLALSLQGGGPDRVIIIDPQTLKTRATLSLPRELPRLDPPPHLP